MELRRTILRNHLPELTRRDDRNRRIGSDAEQVLIAGHEDICTAGDGGRQYPAVCRVADRKRVRSRWFLYNFNTAEDSLDGCDGFVRQPQFFLQRPTQFVKVDLADDQFMFREADPKDIGAEAARGKSGDENIRIQTNPQEIALKISSSVRNPRASAKGSTLRLASSN